MKKISFKIRRKIMLAFLFCFLSVLVFAIFSFQVHREIGNRLRLVEVADDIVNNILEIRRFEKNYFLYKHTESLDEALSYVAGVETLFLKHQEDMAKLHQENSGAAFLKTLGAYRDILLGIKVALPRTTTGSEESLRPIGQELLDTSTGWAKTERLKIDQLFRRAFYLFTLSMLFFGIVGIAVAFYISRLFTRPLIEMQQAMEKIAHGDFTPISEDHSRSEEFVPLFRAFNRMIDELEQRQEQLVQARKISALGTFTSGIAHELNNPVNNIVLTAEALKEDFGSVDHEEAIGMINDIIVQSERASEIIKNLLDFSRSERPEMISVSIPSVITDTLKLVRNQLLLSGVEEHVELSSGLPRICGENKSLQQVFLNLFINAIQAMPNGGALNIKGYASSDGKNVKIDIRDSGVGIKPDDLPHIFDPFFTTKEVGKGTGLGLSVTYSIVRKHGGTIDVHSSRGAGTTFTVSLPSEQKGCEITE